MRKPVHIIGAGFSGLSLAWYLAQRGLRVIVHEKNSRSGGLIDTYKTPYGLLETGASSITSTKLMEDFLIALKVPFMRASKASRKRYLYRDGLKQWPLKPLESLDFLSRLISNLISKQLAPRKNQTIANWAREKLGLAATQYLISPALQGIYAGNIETMSASLILGPHFQKKKKRSIYRGVIAPVNGMKDIFKHLENILKQQGVEIFYGSTPDISKLDHPVVIATSVLDAASLIATLTPSIARQLSFVRMAPMISAVAFFQESNPIRGLGCLIPRNSGFRSLGVLFNSSMFPGRDFRHSETWMIGGATDPNAIELRDDEIKNLILKERSILLGASQEIDHLYVNRWLRALPEYDLTLENILNDLKLPRGIFLHGNYLGGIGLSKILERSHLLAEQIHEFLP